MDEMSREYHPAAMIFPLLDGPDFEQLKADIDANGLLEPIVLHLDGRIIDGRNRHRACIETGTEPHFRTLNGNSDPLAFVVSMNLHRRHLTSSQRAAIAVCAEELVEQLRAEAQERMSAGGIARQQGKEKIPYPENETGQTRDQLATLFNTNGRYIDVASRLKEEEPELFEQVAAGAMPIMKARQTMGRKQKVASVQAYTRSVKDAPALEKVYNVIYADPPWDYGYKNPTGVNIASNHYHTMPLEDIASFPKDTGIQIADNAVLFLWVTNPFLEKALGVVSAWGFQYKTNIAWVKTNRKRPGAGHYVRGQHELLYICTRGAFTPLDKHISPPIGSVLESDQLEHSRKPPEVYDTIERLYPGCVYLELFARNRREGWEAIGNES